MEDFQSESFNSFNKGIGKDIKESANCTNGKNFCLYVVGIPPDFAQKGLHNLFSECGEVLKLNILPPKQPGWPKVAFVEFGKMPEVLKALEMYKEFQLGNFTIKTTIARKREDRSVKSPTSSPTDIDLGEYVERSIEQSRNRAEKRFEKIREQKKQQLKEEEKSMHPCAVCTKPCLSTCGQCKTVFYCGSTCQRDDWISHKKVCKPIGEQHCRMDVSGNEMSDSSDNLMVEVDSVFVNAVKSHVKSIAKPIQSIENIKSNKENRSNAQKKTLLPTCVIVGKSVQASLVDLQIGSRIFYFQLTQNNESLLSSLDHAVNEYYGQGKAVRSVSIEEGGIYACKFSMDQRWYRVCVQNINEDKSVCNVWYIDFANCEDVPSEKLMVLTDEFINDPPFSLRCNLYGCDGVSIENITQMIGEYLNNEPIELKVKDIDNSIALVEIILVMGETRASFNKILIENFFPNKNRTFLKQPSILKPAMQTSKAVYFGDEDNSNLYLNNQEVSVESSICSATKEPPEVRKSPMKSDLSSIFQKIKIKPPREDEMFKAKVADPIVPNGKFDAVITNVDGIESISCCVIGPQQDTFFKLQKDLSTVCENNFLPVIFSEGAICASKCSGEPGWYRAQMLSKVDNNMVSLLFIDFGNKQNVSLEKICKFPKEKKYWELEKQAILCKLKDCTTGSDDFNAECLGLLKQCENQIVMIEIENVDEVQPIPATIYINEESTVNDYITQLKNQFESKRTEQEQKVQSPVGITQKEIQRVEEKTMPMLSSVLDNIKASSKSEVILTHIENPEHMVCQIYENQIKLQDLTAKMAELYENFTSDKCELISGEFYAVKYDIDSMWYRAKILGNVTEVMSGEYNVIFVDYGNEEKVKKKDIRPLLPQFRILPIQGIKFKLHGCVSMEGRKWSNECVAILHSLCNQKFDAVFKSLKHDEAIIDIYVEDDSLFDQLVSAGLIEVGKSKILPPESTVDEDVSSITNQSTAQELDSNSGNNSNSNLVVSSQGSKIAQKNVLNGGPPPLDNFVPSELNSSQIAVVEPSQITPLQNHDEVSKNVADKNPEVNNEINLKVQDLKVEKKVQRLSLPLNEVLQVGVVHVNTPHSFFCQVLNEKSAQIAETLSKLSTSCVEKPQSKKKFFIGDFCVACASDNIWYRSQILQLDDRAEECLVRFIDYGNDEVVRYNNIQEIPYDFVGIESQAVHCKLFGCVSKGQSKWSADSIDTITTLVNQMCHMKILESDGKQYAVELIVGGDLTLNDFLIQQGMAQPEEIPVPKVEKKQDEIVAVDLAVQSLEHHTDSSEKEVKIISGSDVCDSATCTLKDGDMISLQIYKAASPDNMNIKVQSEGRTFSIRCKLADVKAAGESWREKSSEVLMKFSSQYIDAKIVKVEENDEKGKIYVTKIPAFVNALIVAGFAVYCIQ